MNGRAWILALGAGLCGSLSACQTPLGKGGLRNDQIVTAPSDSSPKVDSSEAASPYAAIPRMEKRDNSAKSSAASESTVSASPYSALPPPITPEPPAKAKDYSLEAKRARVLAAVMKPTQAPLPEPPPPEPPTWDPDLPAPTPYAASRNQPPLPAPQFAVGAVTNSNPATPYAAPADQHLVSASKQIAVGAVTNSNPDTPYAAPADQHLGPASKQIAVGTATNPNPDTPYAAPADQHLVSASKQSAPISGLPSPYAAIAGQGTTHSVTKPPIVSADSLSPYAAVPAQSATTHLVQSTAANHTIEKPPSQTSETRKDAEPSPTKADADSHIQQTSSPRELNFREIHEAPATSRPDVDLDWTNESSAFDPSAGRRSDDPPLVTAMRCFLGKRPAEALTWLKRYDEPNQELIMRFLPLMVRIPERDLTRADADKATAILEDLYNLFGFPAEGDLAISKLCLCKHIKTFGDYEPFPEDHQFQPRDLVWIYAEVRNFSCERRDMGNGELFYETQLKTTARITNYDGTREWPLKFDRRYGLDRSRSLRRDYWDNLSFNVPDLPPGGYTLWLKVEDEPTHRFKERTVDFQVVPSKGL
ncbi:MAG TPA: hypothetical protein VGX70_13910 [Gemmataceae bacterium]|jgi:hypothetical protein|nr:hypothetical protein [Gemmataceae bacterium]